VERALPRSSSVSCTRHLNRSQMVLGRKISNLCSCVIYAPRDRPRQSRKSRTDHSVCARDLLSRTISLSRNITTNREAMRIGGPRRFVQMTSGASSPWHDRTTGTSRVRSIGERALACLRLARRSGKGLQNFPLHRTTGATSTATQCQRWTRDDRPNIDRLPALSTPGQRPALSPLRRPS
jgi:hypothetical protein